MPYKDPEARRVYERAYWKRRREARNAKARRWYDKNAERPKPTDVRCANCHKRKTAKQFGWWKLE